MNVLQLMTRPQFALKCQVAFTQALKLSARASGDYPWLGIPLLAILMESRNVEKSSKVGFKNRPKFIFIFQNF